MLSVLNSFVIPHTASADEVSSTSDENIIIYDKNGEVVEPSREIIENNDMIIQPLGVNYPTTVKWLNNGAIPTDTVKNLFSKSGIMEKFHNLKQGK